MWNRALMNLGNPPHKHSANEATADISYPAPVEVPALGAKVVRVNGAKRVLVWSSKQAPLHASSKKHSAHYQSARSKIRGSEITQYGHIVHHRLYIAVMLLITLLGMTLALDQKICS